MAEEYVRYGRADRAQDLAKSHLIMTARGSRSTDRLRARGHQGGVPQKQVRTFGTVTQWWRESNNGPVRQPTARGAGQLEQKQGPESATRPDTAQATRPTHDVIRQKLGGWG